VNAPLVDQVVFFGRYTSFAGETSFPTVPINIVAYDSLRLELWRGPSADAGDLFTLAVEGSVDQLNWTSIGSQTITQSVQQLTVPLDYPWLRVLVDVVAGGAALPVATGYVIGNLYRRRT